MPMISFGTLSCMMKLIGPFAWSSLARVSMLMRSPCLVRLMRTWKGRPDIPSPSTASSLSQVPSGRRARRAFWIVSRHCSWKRAHVSRTVAAPEAREQLLDAPLAEPAARQHRADVAAQDVGKARVAEKDAEGLVVEPPLPVDADGGHDDALVEDLGGVGGDAARAQAADVPEVPPRLREGHQLALVEDRRGEDHVRASATRRRASRGSRCTSRGRPGASSRAGTARR